MKNILNGFVLILIFFCSCADNNNTSDGEEQIIQSGLMEYSFEYDGLTRSYLLYIPSSYNSESECPLVYNFHGFGGQINSYISYADLRSEAESANFILVYPQGSNLNGDPHWNAAPVGGDNKSNTDDFGFIEALNSHLVSNYTINPSKIFACGYSNGGMMAYGLACYKQQIFSAVASISGVMLDTDCVSNSPVSILSVHGTADFVLPYNGNEYYSAVQETLAYWNQTNQTDEEATIRNLSSGTTQIEHYLYANGNGGAKVSHYKIVDGGHDWFNLNIEGHSLEAIIIDFFLNGAN